MDINTFIILYWYQKRRRARTVKRKYWIHPIVSQRHNLGAYRTLMGQLRSDDVKFFNYFRMSQSSFDELLRRVEGDFKRQDTVMRKSITPEEKLVICLR